jgi:hypothetical protein
VVLEKVRSCKVVYKDGLVVITGVDKITSNLRTVTLTQEQYDSWKGGLPIGYVASHLPCEAISFLLRGEWKCRQ